MRTLTHTLSHLPTHTHTHTHLFYCSSAVIVRKYCKEISNWNWWFCVEILFYVRPLVFAFYLWLDLSHRGQFLIGNAINFSLFECLFHIRPSYFFCSLFNDRYFLGSLIRPLLRAAHEVILLHPFRVWQKAFASLWNWTRVLPLTSHLHYTLTIDLMSKNTELIPQNINTVVLPYHQPACKTQNSLTHLLTASMQVKLTYLPSIWPVCEFDNKHNSYYFGNLT